MFTLNFSKNSNQKNIVPNTYHIYFEFEAIQYSSTEIEASGVYEKDPEHYIFVPNAAGDGVDKTKITTSINKKDGISLLRCAAFFAF